MFRVCLFKGMVNRTKMSKISNRPEYIVKRMELIGQSIIPNKLTLGPRKMPVEA